MRLLEFFGQINELRSRIFSRDKGQAYGLYGAKNALVPTHLIVSSDGSDLKYTDDVYILSIQPASLTKYMKEIKTRIMQGEDIPQAEGRRVAMIGLLGNLTLTGDIIRDIGDELPTKKIAELNGRNRIFKYMTTDIGLPESIYTDIFGEAPEMDEGDYTQFHNARLIVPDTMKPKNFEIAKETLEAVYQNLNRVGEVEVFGGVIRFTKLPATTAGLYIPDTQSIAINQNINSKNLSILFTLLHEYGHKKMYISMEKSAVAEVRQKFRELRRSGESHMEDLDYATAVYHAVSQFQVGQELEYIGKAKVWKKNPHYIIKAISSDKSKASLAHTDEPDRVVSDYTMPNLLNPKKWKADGIDFTSPERKAQHDEKSDDWFPSKYSETNHEEWWAELYGYYTLGNLSGEPAAWMQGMLHGNTMETVGGNDGAINSEDDQPIPPPAHGDEEGNASWEWTDPYHSSGTENAVLSNTP